MALQLPGYQLSIGSASPPKHFTEYDNAGFYKMAESIANAGNNLGNALGGYMQRQREQEGLASMASAMNSGDIGAAAMAAAQSGDREMATKLAMYGLQQKQEANALSQVNSILGGGDSGGASTSYGSASNDAPARPAGGNASTAYKMFLDMGYSPTAAAGIVGNLVQESGVRPTGASGDGGTAHGIAQWRADRWNSDHGLIGYANQNGLNPNDLGTQVKFLDWELKNRYGDAYRSIQNAKTPEEAAGMFALKFERPKGAETGNYMNIDGIGNRIRQAKALFGAGAGSEQGPSNPSPAMAANNAPYQVAANGFTPPPSGQPQPQQGPNTDAIIAKMQNMGKVLMLPNVPDNVKAGIKAQMDILNSQLNQANEQYKYSRDTARDDYKFNREMEAKDPSNVMHKETMARLAVGQGMGLTGPALQEYVLNGKASTQASQAPTEAQGNAASFAERAMVANNIASDPAIMKFGLGGTGRTNAALGSLPLGLGQDFQDPGYQQYDAAKTNFITAILRKESGAAIGKEEYAREEAKYFPKFGEKNPEIIQQKADARRLAIETLAKQGTAQFQQEFSKKQQSSNANPMEGRTATNPQTGQRIIHRNGRWEPL